MFQNREADEFCSSTSWALNPNYCYGGSELDKILVISISSESVCQQFVVLSWLDGISKKSVTVELDDLPGWAVDCLLEMLK